MPQPTCIIDGCIRNVFVKKRGYCQPHYNAWYFHGDPHKYSGDNTECAQCRATMQPRRSKYCSEQCRRDAFKEPARVKRRTLALQRRASGAWTCQAAGCAEILTRSNKWCTTHAAEIRRQQPRDNASRICAEVECDRAVRARGICNMHYRRVLRAEGKLKDAWDDRRRSNYHARRARLNGAGKQGHALLVDIIERDGTNCAACGEPVDLDLAYPHRMSKSVDHTVPLSRGGIHALENTRLMHLTCNLSKGATLAPEAA